MDDETVNAIRAQVYREIERLKSLGSEQWTAGVSYVFLQLCLQLVALERIDKIDQRVTEMWKKIDERRNNEG